MMLNKIEEMLDGQVSGFHSYHLGETIYLEYVSRSLCEMTGYQKEELTENNRDAYAQLVHPADREAFDSFLEKLSQKEQTLTAEYRLLKKDGTVRWMRDTAISKKAEDGTVTAGCVLTDITELKKEQDGLQFLNDTIPCGFLKYTCEKQPQLVYLNRTMANILRFPDEEDARRQGLYEGSVFLMIPMEERRRFSDYLERVRRADAPVAGEMTLLRCDGTRARVFGWVTKSTDGQGKEEFQSVCMDVTERYQTKKEAEEKRYLKALTDVYDKIFEFNRGANTVRCLHCGNSSGFKRFEGVAMQMDDALEKWIMDSVAEEDLERVRAFFKDFCSQGKGEEKKPPQISYRARASEGGYRQYNSILVKIDEAVSFYCCRSVSETAETEALRTENGRLKALVMRFTDGLASFEITADGMVRPLYASENVRGFFGYTKDEWELLMEKATPWEQFISFSKAVYEDFHELLKNGEAQFSYFDHQTQTERCIRAVCSKREYGDKSPGYVMLYSTEDTKNGESGEQTGQRVVSIRTFGYFDVFVGDTPIAFRNKKSKELLALLVDRKGGYVSSEEAISFLWEDEPVNTVTLSRYRKVALRLKNTLEEYGISDVIETVDGKRRIIPERVKCDLYEYLSGGEEHVQLFKGSYLSNYSWAETTLGGLLG